MMKHYFHYGLLASSALCLCLCARGAQALPAGGAVSAGDADIRSAGSHTVVFQGSDRAVVDWQSFDIGSGEQVHFAQPGAGSAILNRIHDTDASRIDGALTANGQVYLVNPGGMVFGKGASVDVGSLVATTADISDTDFMKGGMLKFNEAGSPDASISNAGSITVKEGGLAALVAPNVSNSGIIAAKAGTVALASGDTAVVDFYGDELLSVAVSDQIKHLSATNTGTLSAKGGGTVLMTTAEAAGVIDRAINMDGVADASDATDEGGTIVFAGAGADIAVQAGAILDATGVTGGGTVHIGGEYQGGGNTPSAKTTTIAKGVTIDASATQTGNGGEVIVWADKTTVFAGDIKAKGGAKGGDGGFIETSGKDKLYATGNADASAAEGKAGQWLLDPTNVTISNGAGTDVSAGGTFNGNAAIDANTIQTALNNGTSVTITTSSGGGDAGDISMNGVTIAKTNGADATLTLKAENNISIVNSSVTSTLGKLGFVLWSDSDNSGVGLVDVQGSTITTLGGNFVAAGGLDDGSNSGTAGDNIPDNFAWGAGGNVVGVTVNNSIVTTGAGDLKIIGHGENSLGDSRYGSIIYGGSKLTSDGTLTIIGTAGEGTANTNDGVRITGGGTIVSSGTGSIKITGTSALNATQPSSRGVSILSSAIVRSTGTGASAAPITITGDGGTGSWSRWGIYLWNASVTTVDGNVTLNGTGYSMAGSSNNAGVVLENGASITSSGTTSGLGNISVTGNGGTGNNDNYGVALFTANANITSSAGNISVTGNAGNAANDAYGIYIGSGGDIVSTGGIGAAGNISLTGNGGGGGMANHGIYITGNGSTVTTNAGNITATGTGGNGNGTTNNGFWIISQGLVQTASGAITISGTSGVSVGNFQTGSVISDGGRVVSTGSGASVGTITINGVSRGTGMGDYGIILENPGVNATGVFAADANIVLTGSTTSGTGNNHMGVYIRDDNGGGSVSVATTGTTANKGNITITGTGGAGSQFNEGIWIGNPATTISAADGDITLNGTGGNGTGGFSHGVYIYGGATVKTTGMGSTAGNIIITGRGGDDATTAHGFAMDNANTVVRTVDGNITITGTGGATAGGASDGIYLLTDPDILSTGTGNISLTGIAGTGGADFHTGAGTIDIGGAAAQGNITLTANNMNMAVGNFQTTGNIQIAPRSDATTVGVAGGAGLLDISAAVLGMMNAGGTLTIGSATADGAMTVNPYATWATRAGTGVRFLSDDGVITLTAGAHTIGARSLTIETDADPVITGTVTGTGALTLMPSSTTQTMGVAGGAGVVSVSTGDLTNLGTGWSVISLGRTDGLGLLTQDAYSWFAPVTWRAGAAGAGISTTGAQTTVGASNATFTFSGPTTLSSTLDTSAATGGTRAIALNGATTLGTNTTLTAGAGNVTFGSTLNGTHTLDITTTGDVAFTGAAGGITPLGTVTVTDAQNVAATGGLVSSGTINVTATNAITGSYTGTTGSLNSGAGTITATTSFNSLNIQGAGATLSAGYIGAAGDPVNQNMANKISINSVLYPFLTPNAAYTFAGYVIGASNSLGSSPGGSSSPGVTPVPAEPNPVDPSPIPQPPGGGAEAPTAPILPDGSGGTSGGGNGSGVTTSPSALDNSGSGLPSTYTHPASAVDFLLSGDLTLHSNLDPDTDNIDVLYQETGEVRQSSLTERQLYTVDPHLRAWLNAH